MSLLPSFLSDLVAFASWGAVVSVLLLVAVLAVLAAATRGGAPDGDHGGIIVPVENAGGSTARATSATREVLRGGLTIGYLERVVVVAAVLVGRWELLAGLIAIKGLGRFRDLDAGAATERFIIGALVSLTWAGACAVLIVLAWPVAA